MKYLIIYTDLEQETIEAPNDRKALLKAEIKANNRAFNNGGTIEVLKVEKVK